MDTAAIQVLHRDTGYLRLRLPPALRNPATGAMIESALRGVAGVYRVTLLTAEGKLAVRFDPHVCTAGAVALRLKAVLAELPGTDDTIALTPQPEAADMAPAADIGARVGEMRDSFVQALPQRFQPLVESALTEKAVTNFFNDIVAFYLIKVHWELITKQWIKDPVKFGNAWLTVFYLVFLLVRYRKS
jgi:hypothetical protein